MIIRKNYRVLLAQQSGGIMFFRTVMAMGFVFLFNSFCWAAEPGKMFTQKDFAQLIINHFSWAAGLPEDSTDRDYLMILGGKRTFRYEAETAYNASTDRVTVREYSLFGPFTGKGWILGVSDTTFANFTVLLPIRGEYTVKAVIKGDGFIWKVNNKDYRADSKSGNFREVEIGKITFNAGIVTMRVTIPPEGAIDSFSFTAADHTPIQPLIGWRFKEPLNAGRMAEIAVSMTSGYSQLPESKDGPLKTLSVSEAAEIPVTAAKTGIAYLGKFISREWVRADFRGATLQIPVKAADTGFYGITAIVMGDKIRGSVNESRFEVPAKPYLDRINLGLFRLESGDNTITVELPPMGGIDTLDFNKKSTSPDDFLKLAGIKGPAERLIAADEAKAFLNFIQTVHPVRK